MAVTHISVASSLPMLRAPAVKPRKIFLIKFQLGRFLEGQSPHTGLANALLGTAAVVAPAATRSASNAILRLLLTRDLAHTGSSLPKPDCLSAQGRPVVRILLKLCPYPHLSHKGAISFTFFPSKPAQLQCIRMWQWLQSQEKRVPICNIMPFFMHAPNSFPNSTVVTMLCVYAV